MKRLFPQTLFTQTLLVLLAGIAMSLFVGAWIYSSARHEAVRAVGALAAAERIINLSQLIGPAPPDWRGRLVRASSDAAFQAVLTQRKPLFPVQYSKNRAAELIAGFLRQTLPSRQIIAAVMEGEAVKPLAPKAPRTGAAAQASGMSAMNRMTAMMRERMMRRNMMNPAMMQRHMKRHKMMINSLALAAMSWRGLRVAVQLEDGSWLSFATALPDAGPRLSTRLFWALLAMAAIIALLTIWAVRRVTAPLRVLSDAAEKIGRDVKAPPLVASGLVEMRIASNAFNQMQSRLRRMIENRTLMLGAISHDLRTQLTLLRLRLEAGDMTDEHSRMLKTISDMEDMLEAALSFARGEAESEPQKRVDLGALLASITDDMASAGLAVFLAPLERETILACKPVALRRALVNVIDNAVKYGGKADVSLRTAPENVMIMVDDEGPGIPDEQIKQVSQPFYRLENSRNRETGGMGLGLAIAASIIEAHGGNLLIANRPDKGLRITFVLPRRGPRVHAIRDRLRRIPS